MSAAGTVPGTRPATSVDVPRLVELYGECLAELALMRGGSVLMGQGRGQGVGSVSRSFMRQVSSPGSWLAVAAAGGLLVGYASCNEYQLDDGTRIATFQELFVLAAWRRRGIGRALGRGAIDWALERGCSGVDASALPGNRAVKSFFESEGFTARLLVMHRRLT